MCSNASAVKDVKARWKNLRDTFRRVFKARNQVPKSGAAADDEDLDEDVLKKWVFYQCLLFLKYFVTYKA